MCVCVCEKILQWNVNENKSNVFNWHEKKICTKKIAQPSPKKFNGPSLHVYMANIKFKYNFVEAPYTFIVAIK